MKTESETGGETLDDHFEHPGLNELITVYGKRTVGFFSLASHTLTPHFTDFFTDFEKKTTVLPSIYAHRLTLKTLIETPAGHLSGHFI